MVHLMRLQVIRDLRLARGDGRADPSRLGTRYLLMAGDIDGSEPDFLDCLYYTRGDELLHLLGHCYGFERALGTVSVRRYFRQCRIDASLVVRAFEQSRGELALATRARTALTQFAQAHAKADAASLQLDWLALTSELPTRAPSPLPPWRPEWRV